MRPRPTLLTPATVLALCGAAPLTGREPVAVTREAEERAARLCQSNPLQDLWEMIQPHIDKKIDLTFALKGLERFYPERYRILMDEFAAWTMCYIEQGVPPPSYNP